MNPALLSPAAEALMPTLADELRTLLGRVSETRMYPTPEKVAEIVGQSAGWMANEVNMARPFVPHDDIVATVRDIIGSYLPGFVAPHVGTYPKDTIAEVVREGARDIVARLDAANLFRPALSEDPEAQALREAITYVNGRTEKRNGTMGGGYYSSYVSDEDIAAALYAAGWRKQG